MSKTNNVIELNGKCYDVVTGHLIRDVASRPQHVMTMQHVEVVKHPAARTRDEARPAHKLTAARSLKPIKPHQPAKSQTLMRHAVKPSAITPKHDYKPQAPLDAKTQQKLQKLPAVTPKLSSARVSPVRSQHARLIARSDMVRRFSQPVATRPHAAAKPLAAAGVIATPAQPVAKAQPVAPAQPLTRMADISRPAVKAIRQAPPIVQPSRVPLPASQPRPDYRHQTMFNQAIETARSHEQPLAPESALSRVKRHGRRSRRMFAVAAGGLAIVVVAGGVAFANKSSIQLQLASMKAGFHATLPGYKPDGFAVKGLQAQPGAVTVGYNGPSDQSLVVKQQKSNWDSETLLDNYVATTDQSYKAYQAGGRTVFVYGDGNATWVNGGVWYQLQGHGLSDDQMLKVASTM